MAKEIEKINLRSIATKQSPVYLFLAILSLLILISSIFLASTENVSVAEQQAFEFINNLNQSISPILRFFDAVSSIVMVILLAAALLLVRRWRLSLEVFLSGFFALIFSALLTVFVERGRPLEILGEAQIRAAEISGFGFPSINTAIAYAVTTTIAPFVSKRAANFLWIASFLVAVSQLYSGANLPLDVIGGVALGIFIGSAIRFIFGSPNYSRSHEHVRDALASARIKVKEIKQPNVDARGSAPYFVTTEDGQKLFAKIITAENRFADMMFKLWRALVYKDFEDETPYLTAKQALEHEAYVTMLAKSKGVSVPNIRYVISLNRNFAILTMDQLDGESLDSLPKNKVTDKLVKGIWKQVKVMHDAQIAHRDLRLANVFVLSNGSPMLIDFSFGESFASDKRMIMDKVEMLVSFSLIIGARRAVALAESVIGKRSLLELSPYLQVDALAGSTSTALKDSPNVLSQLRSVIAKTTNSELPSLYDLKRLKFTVLWVGLAIIVIAGWALFINT